MINRLFALLILLFTVLIISCNKQNEQSQTIKSEDVMNDGSNVKVTFIELGSVNCIPCKKMQPVMKAIESKYGDQIKVVFYDVWKDQGPAQKYGIRLIPTQIFLDQHGNELLRHEGFFSEAEIDQFLQAQGLKIAQPI